MSLVVTVYAREGIVMAADSRLTLSFIRSHPGSIPHSTSLTSSDSAKKLFVTQTGVGISTFGEATVSGMPIAGVIESFIIEEIGDNVLTPKEIGQSLLSYFKRLEVVQPTFFHVAGYKQVDGSRLQEIVVAGLSAGDISVLNAPGVPGANWGGEIDIFQRLMNQVAMLGDDGTIVHTLPTYEVPFAFFTLQDAIDFACFAIRATSDTMRFQARERTVGGPIDVLVIQPDTFRWIQQKALCIT